MRNPYENPNIAFYAKRNDLDEYRGVFHCAGIMREAVRGDVLDLGAGQGHITDALVNGNPRVRSVLCVDFSEYNKGFLLKKGYRFARADLDRHPYLKKGNAYDTIISSDLIEHLLSPYLNLVECHRLLRKGGCLVLSTPQASKARVTVPHINYFSPRGMELMLRRAGFTSVRRVYNGVLNPGLTRVTSRIPLLRNILSNGCYFIATK